MHLRNDPASQGWALAGERALPGDASPGRSCWGTTRPGTGRPGYWRAPGGFEGQERALRAVLDAELARLDGIGPVTAHLIRD